MSMIMVDHNDSALQWRCFSFVDTNSETASIARTDAFTCDINSEDITWIDDFKHDAHG